MYSMFNYGKFKLGGTLMGFRDGVGDKGGAN